MTVSTLQERAKIADYRPFIRVVHQCLMNEVYTRYEAGNPSEQVKEMAARAITQELTIAQQFARVLVAVPAIQNNLTLSTDTDGNVDGFTIGDEAAFSTVVITVWLTLYGIF